MCIRKLQNYKNKTRDVPRKAGRTQDKRSLVYSGVGAFTTQVITGSVRKL